MKSHSNGAITSPTLQTVGSAGTIVTTPALMSFNHHRASSQPLAPIASVSNSPTNANYPQLIYIPPTSPSATSMHQSHESGQSVVATTIHSPSGLNHSQMDASVRRRTGSLPSIIEFKFVHTTPAGHTSVDGPITSPEGVGAREDHKDDMPLPLSMKYTERDILTQSPPPANTALVHNNHSQPRPLPHSNMGHTILNHMSANNQVENPLNPPTPPQILSIHISQDDETTINTTQPIVSTTVQPLSPSSTSNTSFHAPRGPVQPLTTDGAAPMSSFTTSTASTDDAHSHLPGIIPSSSME